MSAISRREARRAAVFMLFQWDVTGRPLGSLYEGEVDAYTLQLADAVTEHAAALDARITSASDDWTADRLGAVERNILRVAIEELDEGEVPVEVVLDEAVTLAKRYASEDAARLVNGILGKLVRRRRRIEHRRVVDAGGGAAGAGRGRACRARAALRRGGRVARAGDRAPRRAVGARESGRGRARTRAARGGGRCTVLTS